MSDVLERGAGAYQARNYADAAQWFAKALEEDPDNIQARMWLGQSLCAIGRTHEGTAYLREAGQDLLEFARDDANVYFVLEIVQHLQQSNDFLGAYELGRQAAEINPKDVSAQRLLAVSCAQLNKKQEALSAGAAALKLAPQDKMMQVLYASLQADAGQSAEALRTLDGALAAGLGPREEFRAHKEFARILDKVGRYGEVFPHLQKSAHLAATLQEYARQNPALLSNLILANKTGYDRALLGRWSGSAFAPDQPAPVFLVGFFRSGTTLTQEVLDVHPEVFVADETDFVWAMQRELQQMSGMGGSVPDMLRRIDLAGIKRLRAAYWRRARERVGDAVSRRVFVDKFTMNTVDLGLINCVFPDAKIVFVMRDPRDVALSCFMQLMVPTPATVHLLTWKGTAAFYAQVMDWWMHIRNQLSIPYIEFRYEDAIANFEATYRRVFDFLGLSWDPAVAKFHEHAAKKFIASPSRNQVAQPLYSSSVARWKHYAAEFAPVAAVLAPFVRAFDYDPF